MDGSCNCVTPKQRELKDQWICKVHGSMEVVEIPISIGSSIVRKAMVPKKEEKPIVVSDG